jgi:hypothetical protein
MHSVGQELSQRHLPSDQLLLGLATSTDCWGQGKEKLPNTLPRSPILIFPSRAHHPHPRQTGQVLRNLPAPLCEDRTLDSTSMAKSSLRAATAVDTLLLDRALSHQHPTGKKDTTSLHTKKKNHSKEHSVLPLLGLP